jgi:hypothetical protein
MCSSNYQLLLTVCAAVTISTYSKEVEKFRIREREIFHSGNKTNQRPKAKIIFLHTICPNSDTFRSVLIILSELVIIDIQ